MRVQEKLLAGMSHARAARPPCCRACLDFDFDFLDLVTVQV